jgi:DnaJ-domain-containing protein 1
MQQEEEERRRKLRTLEQLQQLTGREFEDLIAGLFREDGYTVRQCGGSGDEGIDLIIEISMSKDVVQCKRWKSDVGSPVVRDFYGALMHASARHGFIITTASFSESAHSFARGKAISLISGPDLIRWIDGSYSARCAAQNPRQQKPKPEPVTTALFDPFSVLGILRGANQEEIRAAYRREMSNYHPDKVAHLGSELQQLAERKAQAINRAYTELLREH